MKVNRDSKGNLGHVVLQGSYEYEKELEKEIRWTYLNGECIRTFSIISRKLFGQKVEVGGVNRANKEVLEEDLLAKLPRKLKAKVASELKEIFYSS